MKARKVEFILHRGISSSRGPGVVVSAYDMSEAYMMVTFAGDMGDNVCRTTHQGEFLGVDNYGSWV